MIWFKISISGHASSRGSQFPVIGRFWWSILQVIFVVPITLYTFFRTIYDFGPKHRKRSLFDILQNPVPGIEFKGRPGESDDFDSLQRRRFNHCILARRIARRKHLTQKRTTQSMSPIIHDCRMSYIDPSALRLYGYESYFTSQDAKVDLKPLIVAVIPIYCLSETINLSFFLFLSVFNKLIIFNANKIF